MEAKRILKNIDVQFLSLVTAGANGKSIIYKSANQAAPNFQKEIKIIKTDEEKHLVYATVYEPDTVDSQGDIANAVEIEKACHKFSENLRLLKVDTQHNFDPNGSVVVENFIMRSADPMFPTTKTGSWVTVIKVAAEEIWAQIKSGEIGGLSLFGLSGIKPVEKGDGLIARLEKTFEGLLVKCENLLYGDEFVTKAGKKISQKNIDKIKAAQQQLADIIASATAETTTDGEETMKAEEVAKLVADELAKALKPLTDEVAKVTGEITTIKADLKKAADRVEEVAKASPGSKQVEGDPLQVKKSKTNWLS